MEERYIWSAGSEVYHRPGCPRVARILPKLRREGDLQAAEQGGRRRCYRCSYYPFGLPDYPSPAANGRRRTPPGTLELTPEQHRFLRWLVLCKTVGQAANAAGVRYEDGLAWYNDPQFRELYRKIRDAHVEREARLAAGRAPSGRDGRAAQQPAPASSRQRAAPRPSRERPQGPPCVWSKIRPVYHLRECRWARRIARENREGGTRFEAWTNGRRPCRVCIDR